MAPVAVSVALQALQQDPDTHANRSNHLPSINPPAIDQSTCHRSIHLPSINPPAIDRPTCHRSIKPSGLPHSNPSINLAGRNTKSIHLSGRHRTIIQSNREGCHTTIHQPIWQIAAKLSINPPGMPQHKNTSFYLVGCPKTITQSTWQDATEKSINPTGQAATQQSINLYDRLQVATQLSNNPPGRSQHKINHSIWQAAKQLSTINQSTWQAPTQKYTNLSGRPQHNNPSIQPGRLPHNNPPTYLADSNKTINQSTWQAATQQPINLSDRLPHNYQPILLSGGKKKSRTWSLSP